MAALIEESGGRAWAEQEADRWVTPARESLRRACPGDATGLDIVIAAAIRRTH
ncbi:hypothetical protein [Streptomyces sp. NPDC048142]|uniref:hypothetical protein n=1 Tax=Streptomyces sp. NPDC048142 TaxID=3365501 RepID=UPI00371DE202